jgi:hypothetical protein
MTAFATKVTAKSSSTFTDRFAKRRCTQRSTLAQLHPLSLLAMIEFKEAKKGET